MYPAAPPLANTELEMAPVDVDAFLSMTDGDREFARELISEFSANGNRSLEIIRCAIRDNDLRSLAQSAHSLKGASAALHASLVRSLAERLEYPPVDISAADLATLAAQLQAEVRRAIDYLSEKVA